MFDHKVWQDQLNMVASYIAEKSGGGILYSEEIDEKTGNTIVSELLKNTLCYWIGE